VGIKISQNEEVKTMRKKQQTKQELDYWKKRFDILWEQIEEKENQHKKMMKACDKAGIDYVNPEMESVENELAELYSEFDMLDVMIKRLEKEYKMKEIMDRQ
jgi:Fe-S-cluster-containing hydrogenase component 2